jgi:hypothetical protein
VTGVAEKALLGLRIDAIRSQLSAKPAIMAASIGPVTQPKRLSAPAPAADGQPNQRWERNSPKRPSRRGRMLGPPLGARSAHVVQLGTVGIEQRLGEIVEQLAELCRQARGIAAEVAYANYGPTHGDAAALHLPPSTAAFAY